MAAITGATGAVTSWANNTLLIATNSDPATFVLNYVADEQDTTAFGAATSMSAIAGLTSWSGTISTRYDAAAIGNLGSVTYSNGYAANVNSWSMDIASDPKETTAFSATAKTFIPSLYRWGGSYDAFYDSLTANPLVIPGENPPSSATFSFDGTRSLEGDITILDQNVTSSPAEINTASQSYRGSSTLTAAGAAGFFAAGEVALPVIGSLVLTTNTDSGTGIHTFTGDAFWTSLSLSVPTPGLITLEIGFQGTGALVIV